VQAIVAAKYRVVSRPISRAPDKAQYLAWKDQESEETVGRFFFAETDLAGARHLKHDATGRAILTVLQRLGRLASVPGAARRYIVLDA